MALKPPSIRRRKYKKKDEGGDTGCDDTRLSSSQIVEEAQRENMMHRGLSDLLMGCCTGVEVDIGADERDNAFDISRELEELEKEISLAKEMKKNEGAKDVETEADASGDKNTKVGRNTPASLPGLQADAMGAISSAVSSSSSSLLSSSASWTEQMSESVESNMKFLVGSCSSRQVHVDSMPETAFEV